MKYGKPGETHKYLFLPQESPTFLDWVTRLEKVMLVNTVVCCITDVLVNNNVEITDVATLVCIGTFYDVCKTK
jgi:hypothetical protein